MVSEAELESEIHQIAEADLHDHDHDARPLTSSTQAGSRRVPSPQQDAVAVDRRHRRHEEHDAVLGRLDRAALVAEEILDRAQPLTGRDLVAGVDLGAATSPPRARRATRSAARARATAPATDRPRACRARAARSATPPREQVDGGLLEQAAATRLGDDRRARRRRPPRRSSCPRCARRAVPGSRFSKPNAIAMRRAVCVDLRLVEEHERVQRLDHVAAVQVDEVVARLDQLVEDVVGQRLGERAVARRPGTCGSGSCRPAARRTASAAGTRRDSRTRARRTRPRERRPGRARARASARPGSRSTRSRARPRAGRASARRRLRARRRAETRRRRAPGCRTGAAVVRSCLTSLEMRTPYRRPSSQTEGARMKRVVTGWDESGKPAILFEGEPPTVMDFGPIVTTELWVTDSTPPDPKTRTDTSTRHVGSAAARRRPGLPHRDVPPAVRQPTRRRPTTGPTSSRPTRPTRSTSSPSSRARSRWSSRAARSRSGRATPWCSRARRTTGSTRAPFRASSRACSSARGPEHADVLRRHPPPRSCLGALATARATVRLGRARCVHGRARRHRLRRAGRPAGR